MKHTTVMAFCTVGIIASFVAMLCVLDVIELLTITTPFVIMLMW